MTIIFADGFRIEITSEITYTRYSPVFNALKGDWSFPFSIQGTDEILAYFNYPHLPQASVLHQRLYENVSLYEGSFLIGNGTLTLQDCTSKQIIAHLNGTSGNIPLKTWERKMNQLDLGGETIPTVKIDGSKYFWELSWSKITLPELNRLDYQYYNCFIFVDGKQIGETGILDYSENGFQGRSFDEFKVKQINNFKQNIVGKLIMSSNNDIISIYSPTALNELKIVFIGYPNLSRYDSFGFIQFSKISYEIIDQNYYTTRIINDIYVLPQIQDNTFYSNSDSGFYGVINQTENNKILINVDGALSRHTIIPQLRFSWAIKKLMNFLNYQIIGSFLDDSEILKLILLSLFSTDKQSAYTLIPFNVHQEQIYYAKFLPPISLAEFLKDLMDEFGLGIEFNILTKTVEYFFVKDVLLANDNILNLNDRVRVLPKHSLTEIRKTQVSYNVSNDSAPNTNLAPYIPVPTNFIVDNDVNPYDKIELKFPPITKTLTNLIQIENNGVSPLFKQFTNESPLRFFFFEDNIGKVESANLSLDLNKPNSNYQKYIKPKIDFEANTMDLETTALMTILEIASFSFKTKILAYNILWLCDELSVKLKTGQEVYEVTLKLKRT